MLQRDVYLEYEQEEHVRELTPQEEMRVLDAIEKSAENQLTTMRILDEITRRILRLKLEIGVKN